MKNNMMKYGVFLLGLLAGVVVGGGVNAMAGDAAYDNVSVMNSLTSYGPVNLVAVTNSGSVPYNGLVFYANFNTNTLPTADLSGNNNTGFLSGGVAYTTGANGKGGAYDFDGTTGYMTFGTPTGSMNLSGNTLTVGAWIYQHTTAFCKGWIFCKAGSAYSYGLWMDGNNHVALSLNTGAWANYISSTVVSPTPLNSWHHVMVTYNGSCIRFYWDGVMYTPDIARTGNLVPGNAPASIGRDYPGFSQTFDGVIDEVMVYNRALSSNEVYGIYSCTMTNVAGAGTLSALAINLNGQTVTNWTQVANNVNMTNVSFATDMSMGTFTNKAW